MILCRRSITHPIAGKIELPMLIPAFSSKGFNFITKKKKCFSELAYALEEYTRHPIQNLLVSAYDLHFDHFIAPDLPVKKVEYYLRNTQIVFLDSGGYELSTDFDSTEIKTFIYQPKDGFGRQEYENYLHHLIKNKNTLHFVISNFDHDSNGQLLENQVKQARKLFNKYPNCLNDFIIKPWTKDSKIVDPLKMSNFDFASLKGFNIIGITEKELGLNVFDRIKRIAYLRKGLNEAGISSPIHIWGGLDPLITPLFFFAGAEIFDGISWLRYAYRNGISINKNNYSILKPEIGISSPFKLNETLSGFDNLRFLDNLTISLQQWIDFEGKNFDMFDPHIKDYLNQAFTTMKTKMDFI